MTSNYSLRCEQLEASILLRPLIVFDTDILMTTYLRRAVLPMLASLPLIAFAVDDAHRQAEISKLGPDVMPFSLKATIHIFTKTTRGGVQRVVAKSSTDAKQVRLVREHLRDIQAQFLKGDFSGPTYIHGEEMPGLAALKAAKRDQIAITYKDVASGAELSYRTSDRRLATALHQWFDAQVSDHGLDAMAGHAGHHEHSATTKR